MPRRITSTNFAVRSITISGPPQAKERLRPRQDNERKRKQSQLYNTVPDFDAKIADLQAFRVRLEVVNQCGDTGGKWKSFMLSLRSIWRGSEMKKASDCGSTRKIATW